MAPAFYPSYPSLSLDGIGLQPELNPDEYLNNDVKANVHRRAMPRTKEELKYNVTQHLRKIARSPKRVRSYFQAKHIRYAA